MLVSLCLNQGVYCVFYLYGAFYYTHIHTPIRTLTVKTPTKKLREHQKKRFRLKCLRSSNHDFEFDQGRKQNTTADTVFPDHGRCLQKPNCPFINNDPPLMCPFLNNDHPSFLVQNFFSEKKTTTTPLSWYKNFFQKKCSE